MATNYPTGFDSYSTINASDPRNNPSLSQRLVNLGDAVEAIQAELGLTPSSSSPTVRERVEEIETAIPPGVLFAWGSGSIPSGWLLCNGAAVSRTTYSALFAVCGTSFGAGNGSTTFNLPNCTNRFLVGAGSSPFTSVGVGVGSGFLHSHAMNHHVAHTHSLGTTGVHNHDGNSFQANGSTGKKGGSGPVDAVNENHNHSLGNDGNHNHGGATGSQVMPSHTIGFATYPILVIRYIIRT